MITADVAVAIAFVIFVGLVVWKGAGRIIAALDKRSDDIRAQLEEAQALCEEAQSAFARYQRQQRDVESEAEAILAQAREDAERYKRNAEANLAATLKRREEQAIERIAQAEAKALQEVRAEVVDIAIDASSRLIEDGLTAEVHSRLIGEAGRDLGTRLQSPSVD